MDNPMQGIQSNVPEWLQDPRNLATGLVFLAALAQPRPRGVNTGGAVAQNALGALAFRGGLDTQLKKERQSDEDRRNQQLELDRREEQRGIENRARQQGLELQGRGLQQNERLAREQMQTQRDLATAVRPETPEEARLKTSMAAYYDRMPKEGGAGGTKDFRTQMFEDLFKTQWESEVAQAALEGRQPDVLKIIPQMSNLMAGLNALPAGMKLERDSNGVLSIVIPGNPDGAPPPSAPATTPAQAGASAEASGVPIVPAMGVGVNLQSDVPIGSTQLPVGQKPLGRGSRAPQGQDSTQWAETIRLMRQVGSLPTDRLEAFLKDPRLSKDQVITIRSELNKRARTRAPMSRNF